jgi:PKD repeat protein
LANQQFLVTLRSFTSSGCSDTAKYPVLVYPQPTAFFAPSVNEGCGPLPLTFNNQSAADFSGSSGMTFNWNFGNGQTDTARQPNVIMLPNAIKDTVYNVRLITSS